VRYLFLQARYRSQFNFTWDALAGAERALGRLRDRMAEWSRSPAGDGQAPDGDTAALAAYQRRFRAAIDDDLDTPKALTVLGELESDETLPPAARFRAVAGFDRILGLDLANAAGEVLPDGAGELIARRERARAERDWAAADRLRDQLAGLGVEVVDTRSGTQWRLRR